MDGRAAVPGQGLKEIYAYTAVFGRGDVLLEPAFEAWDVPLYCFTDLRFKGKSMWQMVHVDLGNLPRAKRNRKVKIWWPPVFKGCLYSLYLDSTAELLVDPRELIQFLEPGSDICVFGHPERDCLYEEARAVIQFRRADPQLVRRQIVAYREKGIAPHSGLWACTVILRRHTGFMRDFCRRWLEEVMQFSHRDQISFPVVVQETGAKVSTFPGSLLNNEFISWRPWERRDPGYKSLWEEV
jgi:hypothetical protein